MKYSRLFLFISLALILVFGCGKQQSEDEMLLEAKQKFTEGQYKSSNVILKNIVKSNQNNNKARLLLADSYMKLGQYRFAEKRVSIRFKWRIHIS